MIVDLKPYRDAREQSVEDPPHLLALRGELPADTCACCAEPIALHYDTSMCVWIGCLGVPARKALSALTIRPLQHRAVWGDAHPKVSAAIRDVLLAGCGPDVTAFYEGLGPDDRLALSRRLAEIAVIAFRQEEAQR